MPSTGSGSRSCDGYQVSTNGTSSPASSSNSATVVRSRPRVGRPGIRCTASGPAIAVSAAVVGAPDPRDDAAEVEAQDQLHPHADAALEAAGDAHDVGRLVADRHRVDDLEHAVGGVEVGLEHERALAVAALGPLDVVGGREQPAPVRLVAEQRGEAGGRVEARQAEPVDRAVVCRRAPPSACRRSARSPRSAAPSAVRPDYPAARHRVATCRPQAEVARGNDGAVGRLPRSWTRWSSDPRDGLADAVARGLRRRGLDGAAGDRGRRRATASALPGCSTRPAARRS